MSTINLTSIVALGLCGYLGKADSVKAYCLLIATAATIAAALPAICGPLRYDSFHRGDREMSVMVGTGANHRYPAATKERFQFDTVKLRYGVFTSPRTQVSVDLTSGLLKDADNSAVWATAGYRRYFLVRGQTAVGYDFNFGLLRLSHMLQELGTRTNFTEQMGIVFQHSTGDNSALTIDYKFSHVSNAGIVLPNIGINASLVSVGYSWYN